MKKYLSICLLLTGITLGLQSCLFSEEDIFDDSSANRLTADVIKCREILQSVPNGWKLEYYVGADYTMGGTTLLMRFDENNVEMTGTIGPDGFTSGDIVKSLYQVQSEQSTMITFDSYNSLMHLYAAPLEVNMNLQGDYEFIVMSASEDKIVLQGKRYGNIMEMTPVPKDIPWRIVLQDISEVEKEAFLDTYYLKKGGKVVSRIMREKGTLATFSLSNEGQETAKVIPYIYTEKGLKFQRPFDLDGIEMQNFEWDRKQRLFVCSDLSASDVTLSEYYPEDYMSYDDYIGRYMAQVEVLDNTGSFSPKLIPVTIMAKEQGESYTLRGLDFDFTLQYDKATGKLLLDSQNFGVMSNGYYMACASGVVGYAHTELGLPSRLRSGLVGIVTAIEPITISLLDKQAFEDANLLVWVYDTAKYSTSTALGYGAWYNNISLEKQN